jgi:mannose-6-phosphate isomerase-like protein (cupin superfamily)
MWGTLADFNRVGTEGDGMADYTAQRIEDIETMFAGGIRRARSALGVTSFGMQVLELPPNLERYPEHDHAEAGMEEVYVVLRGGGEIEIDGERVPLDTDTIVRVGADAKRKIWPGAEGMRILALGGTPGQAYHVYDFTEVGAPDPFAR